jgi:hypothetical protein
LGYKEISLEQVENGIQRVKERHRMGLGTRWLKNCGRKNMGEWKRACEIISNVSYVYNKGVEFRKVDKATR